MKKRMALFSLDSIKKDKGLIQFLLILIVIHISFYTIENTSVFTKNFQVQIQKIRKNNVEQLLYLVCAIVVFVVGAELGFTAAGFSECYRRLSFFFQIYIASLLIAFICNSLCAQTAPLISLIDGNGETPKVPYPNGVPFLSPTRNKFFYTVAQYLLTMTYQVQTLILSYFSFGIVASYTASYSLGLLSRSLLESK
jgi:hypothetical protein